MEMDEPVKPEKTKYYYNGNFMQVSFMADKMHYETYLEQYNSRLHYPVSDELDALLVDGQLVELDKDFQIITDLSPDNKWTIAIPLPDNSKDMDDEPVLIGTIIDDFKNRKEIFIPASHSEPVYITETGALISENDYNFLSDNEKRMCKIYLPDKSKEANKKMATVTIIDALMEWVNKNDKMSIHRKEFFDLAKFIGSKLEPEPITVKQDERLFTLEEMKVIYEAGQSDCGEFGKVMGFESCMYEKFGIDTKTIQP